MVISSHPMRREEDWWEVRDFLVATFAIAPPGHVWEIRRWDGHRFHRARPDGPPWDGTTRIWRSAGRIVAVGHREASRDLAIEVHPDHRSLEPEIIAWGEDHLAADTPDGRVLEIQSYDYDIVRRRVLTERGYAPTDDGDVIRRLWLGERAFAAPGLPDGYAMRAARADDAADAAAFASLLNAAFGRTWHSGTEVLAFRTGSPSYREDLDLMVEAPDGSLAASVGITIDEVNRAGTFEPVLTHPDHRRLGLASAVMAEGFRVMRANGALTAWVGTGLRSDANALYDRVGFTEVHTGRAWRTMM